MLVRKVLSTVLLHLQKHFSTRAFKHTQDTSQQILRFNMVISRTDNSKDLPSTGSEGVVDLMIARINIRFKGALVRLLFMNHGPSLKHLRLN